jgi:hypothetical protein
MKKYKLPEHMKMNTMDILNSQKKFTSTELEEMKWGDFVDLLIPLLQAVLEGQYPKNPYPFIGKLVKEHGRKRVYEFFDRYALPKNRHILRRYPKRRGFVIAMLRDGFVETPEYPEIDCSEEGIYGV